MPRVRRKTPRRVRRKTAAAQARSGYSRRGRRGARKGGWWWRWPLKFGFAIVLFLLIGCGLALVAYAGLAKDYDLTKLGRMPSRSVVYDRNGEEIGRLHGSNRAVVPLADVSTHFRTALLVREDNRFYDHKGIDPMGVVRAAYRNVAKNKREGASTITMQLARNSFSELMEQDTLHRKLVEVMLARRIEKQFTKDQILEFYVNRIFFGSGIYGVELASQSYFGKHAKDMTLSESAMLAGIIRGPNRFSPFRHYDDAVAERDTVLARMLAEGAVTAAEHDRAKAERVHVREQSETRREREDSYALDAVRRDLEDALGKSDAEDGGLHIHTSIDLRLQRAAESALERGLSAIERRSGYAHQTRAGFARAGGKGDPRYLQGAVVLLDNQTGGALAVVGGRDIKHSQFNRALSARRPVGSAFKPFVYMAALADGMMPGDAFSDGPLRRGEIGGAGADWHPRNSDGSSLGVVGADLALVKSRNTAMVRVGDRAGLGEVKALAGKVGVEIGDDETSPQIYLGNLDCDLESLTSAYTVFPNAGARVPAFTISHIANAHGQVFYRAAAQSYPAAPAGAAAVTAGVMRRVMEPGGTGSAARRLGFRAPAGGKTGTTDGFKDAWFLGFTSQVTCGVWAGLDQPATIAPGAYGGTVALPVWTEVLLACEKYGYRASSLNAPIQMADIELCRASGCFAEASCWRAGQGYKAKLPYTMAPKKSCAIHAGQHAGAAPRAEAIRRPRVLKRLLKPD